MNKKVRVLSIYDESIIPYGYEHDPDAELLLVSEGTTLNKYVEVSHVLVISDGEVVPLLDLALELGVGICLPSRTDLRLAINLNFRFFTDIFPVFIEGTKLIADSVDTLNPTLIPHYECYAYGKSGGRFQLIANIPFQSRELHDTLVVACNETEVRRCRMQDKLGDIDEILDNAIWCNTIDEVASIKTRLATTITVIFKADLEIYLQLQKQNLPRAKFLRIVNNELLEI